MFNFFSGSDPCAFVCFADCDKLRKDGFRSSQYYSQGPTFSGSAHSRSSQQEDEDEDDIDDKVTVWLMQIPSLVTSGGHKRCHKVAGVEIHQPAEVLLSK